MNEWPKENKKTLVGVSGLDLNLIQVKRYTTRCMVTYKKQKTKSVHDDYK